MVAVRSLCVFCGSSKGNVGEHAAAAHELGVLLAERNIDLVYGGAQVGLMGVLADACLGAGGRVVGVIPRGLFSREVPHQRLTELHEVGSMHERKGLMYDLADAFVALPGGMGTIDELAEVATWSQLGLHAKPVVLLDVGGFWRPFVALLDQMVADGFLSPASRGLIQVASTPDEALDRLATAPPTVARQ
jgi:uncharacterized protein (TIGR00730 family)